MHKHHDHRNHADILPELVAFNKVYPATVIEQIDRRNGDIYIGIGWWEPLHSLLMLILQWYHLHIIIIIIIIAVLASVAAVAATA